MKPTRLRSRTLVACPWCGKHFPTEDGWAWACGACAGAALLEALAGITAAICDDVSPRICPLDGCLVMPDESCPACEVRGVPPARRRNRLQYSDKEHDPKRPVAWVRRGLIQVPVYEQSEVA